MRTSMRIRKDGPIGNVVEKIKTKVRNLITELRSEGGNKKIIRVLSYVLMAVSGALIIKSRVEYNSRMKDLKKAKDSVNRMADEMGLEGEARGVITSRVEATAASAEEIAHRKFVLHGLAGLIGLLMSLISRAYSSAAREDSMRTDSLKRYIDRAIEREVRRYLRDYGVKGMKKGQHIKAQPDQPSAPTAPKKKKLLSGGKKANLLVRAGALHGLLSTKAANALTFGKVKAIRNGANLAKTNWEYVNGRL